MKGIFVRRDQTGYVALEFVVAMGLLVLPIALVLLQIPSFLERHNRLESISAIVSQTCATKANTSTQGNEIARTIAENEMESSSVMKHVSLVSSSCSFQDSGLSPGTKVTSTVTMSMAAAVVPGSDMGPTWTMTETHVSVVPKYRSYSESP